MWSWFRWFGILLGAISLFSLVQKLSDFGLSPIFKDMLAFYRAAFHPVADLIISGLSWAFSLVFDKMPFGSSHAFELRRESQQPSRATSNSKIAYWQQKLPTGIRWETERNLQPNALSRPKGQHPVKLLT